MADDGFTQKSHSVDAIDRWHARFGYAAFIAGLFLSALGAAATVVLLVLVALQGSSLTTARALFEVCCLTQLVAASAYYLGKERA